jgi:RNA polymerase sigma-70 factor (ECF subfamily)
MASEPANSITQSPSPIASPPADREPADRELLERFVTAQDQSAFTALVQRHGPMVLGVCRRLLHDRHEVEDAFQATFLVLVHKARSIGRPELLGPWLHGVAYRTSARARQAARRRARTREAEAMPDSDPAVEAVWRDLRQVLDEELGRLAQKYRVPMVLVYLEGKTTDEVARQLGCPRGTVLSRLARGRERMRDRLVRRGVALSVWVLAGVLKAKAAPAAVPVAVANGTIKAAVLTAAGKATTGAVSATVAALTKGVLRTMFLNKVKAAVAVVLALSIVVASTVVVARRALADKPVVTNADEASKDEEKILGTWTLVSFEEGGQKAPEEKIKMATATLTADGRMIFKMGEQEQQFTYKLDPSKTPKTFDGTNDRGRTALGIYKLDGDTLTVCFERGGGDRPTEFASKEGTTVVLEVLKREKK